MATECAQTIQNTCTASNNIIDVGIVIERLYVRVTPRTEMRWTLSKPCTVGGGRSVMRRNLNVTPKTTQQRI